MSDSIDYIKLQVKGHVLIVDSETNEVILDKTNAIHPENLSLAIANAMADEPNGHIQQIVFGNGASTVSAVSDVSYFPPNIVGGGAQLYNQTYSKVIDSQSLLNSDPVNNSITVAHTANTTYSDLVVKCTLTKQEPNGQMAFDNATIVNRNTTSLAGGLVVSSDPTAAFLFDEIGLQTVDPVTGNTLLLSHVIFHPILKSLNRSFTVFYTLRFVLG